MFQDEARYKFDHFLQETDMPTNHVAKIYMENRASLVERIFSLGKKFNQRSKTIHIAVELLDRFFLDKSAQGMREVEAMTPRV